MQIDLFLCAQAGYLSQQKQELHTFLHCTQSHLLLVYDVCKNKVFGGEFLHLDIR